ncbi:MAG: tRNA (adenosine(37)-N6)-dimethylallyltransferase MiaA [Gammaproteobacteria bacterium]
MRIDAILLCGPTAGGKSGLALELARRAPVEIVSVDSAQVYRGLDIGSAKPSPELRAAVPHHLIDLRDPQRTYSAGEFVADALQAIADIRARGRMPLLVGGTMLYFNALLRGLAPLPRADAALRARLDARGAAEGWPALHAELAAVDPEAAVRIHPNDPQRIQRALEVWYASGRSISDWQRDTAPRHGLVFERWALVPADRAALHQRIAERFHAMMAAGLLEEVRALRARPGLEATAPSLRAVGYRQLWRYLDGPQSSQTLTAAVDAAIAATRQLAKRQLTWISADAGWQRLDPLDPPAADRWLDAMRDACRCFGAGTSGVVNLSQHAGQV